MKKTALIFLVCLCSALCACGRDAEKAPPQRVPVVRETTTKSSDQILSNMWSIIPEYKGSGTVYAVRALSSAGRETMYVKYSFAGQEDVLAYAQSLNLPEEWTPPKYEGDSYCLEHRSGDSHSVRITYDPTEKEDNFEIRIIMYKPVG